MHLLLRLGQGMLSCWQWGLCTGGGLTGSLEVVRDSIWWEKWVLRGESILGIRLYYSAKGLGEGEVPYRKGTLSNFPLHCKFKYYNDLRMLTKLRSDSICSFFSLTL